ncbi:MAG: hypothetical protein BroJett009_24240 [Armatimonadota bacterium]|nr:MAG: hypothetical protein BroJett009_24240 [Armatimonadota bacterium]
MAALIPRNDPEFDAFQNNAYSIINGNLAAYGLVAADMVPVTAAKTDWDADYPAAITAKAAAQAAVAGKDASRATYEAALRVIFAKILANPSVDPVDLEKAGLPVYDTILTPSPVPSTRPVMLLDTSERYRHTVNFADEGTPTSKAKPAGVMGCELRVFVGATPPADPQDYDFAALDTKTPQTWNFDPADAGQMGHWVARWVNTRGDQGPWSDTVSATIPG